MDESDSEEATTVELRFYAPFKDAVDQKSVAFELPDDATLSDALARAVEEYPDLDGKLVAEDGELSSGVRALHNGHARAEADTRLEDGDEVSFTTPIHGG
ncbi:molybdopterin synthase sulfur carrier subunit [Halobacteriales archaeon SW_6_65_15]|nr:MAG: molybdopterin synthase sulfur carrier subunit [Halobacteriales archaeon SW_6_65_15]